MCNHSVHWPQLILSFYNLLSDFEVSTFDSIANEMKWALAIFYAMQ